MTSISRKADGDAGCTVLIVEDDLDIREALSEVLQGEGYQVLEAENGAEALRRLHERLPGVILLDLRMPVMNGWQFRREQVRHAHFADIPVVVISADRAAEADAESLGVEAFLPKPIDLEVLLDTVQRLQNR